MRLQMTFGKREHMSKIMIAVFATISLMACNKAESLEPQLQGIWNNMTTTNWRQIRFSNGVIIASQGQKPPLQGKYKLEDKTLKLELYANVGGKQVKQEVQSATIEKLDENALELKMNAQTLSFVRDIP
jgi:hypothetical protein